MPRTIVLGPYQISTSGRRRLFRGSCRELFFHQGVARKLSVLLHRLWADGTEVRPAKVEGTT